MKKKLSVDVLRQRKDKLKKSLAFATPARSKRKFKKEADDYIPHKRIFSATKLPSTLDSAETIECLNELDLYVKH